MDNAEQKERHYVYLYRASGGSPRYVGYGAAYTRATAHLVASHNKALADFLSREQFRLEIAGPFASRETALAVEAALISAMQPDLNVQPGVAVGQFRPLGVPEQYAERLLLPRLDLMDFLKAQGSSCRPVLFVRIGDADFGDGRAPYDPSNPPDGDRLLQRVDRWWQVGNRLQAWAQHSETSPHLLVGVTGSPGAQIVVASVHIDTSRWSHVDAFPGGHGKVRIPVLPTPNLDAFELRGRRIDRAARLVFDGISSGFYIVLSPDGRVEGGRRARASTTSSPS